MQPERTGPPDPGEQPSEMARGRSEAPLSKQMLAARIRADLAEQRIKRKDLARWTERSVKTIERWTKDDAENERYRPSRAEAIVLAYLTGYPVSRYTGDERDDILFPLSGTVQALSDRLRAAEEHAARQPDREAGR
jgi:hypothetical protein